MTSWADALYAGAIYLGWAVVVIMLAVALGGCTVAPDTLCQLPRPVASVNDTAPTFATQWRAAKACDSRCTVRGWVTR
jgi:hypothetical protein